MVTGKITDATGAGVVGVTISVKGTQRGTTTNGDGELFHRGKRQMKR